MIVRSVGIVVLLCFSGVIDAKYRVRYEVDVNVHDENPSDDGLWTLAKLADTKLDKIDVQVQSITPHIKDNLELSLYKLLDKLDTIITHKFEVLSTRIDHKLTSIEKELSAIKNNCCKGNIAHVNQTKLPLIEKQMNSTLVVLLNLTKQNDETLATAKEVCHNLTQLIQNGNNESNVVTTTEQVRNDSVHVTTEASEQRPKCNIDTEECCTKVVPDHYDFKEYTNISTSDWIHTTALVSDKGLEEFRMNFAVRGEWLDMTLSENKSIEDMYYEICQVKSQSSPSHTFSKDVDFTEDFQWNFAFRVEGSGHTYLWEQAPPTPGSYVYDEYMYGSIATQQYTHYYVNISSDKLEVGKKGELPFVKRHHTEMWRLKYFSFRWFGHTVGKALVDCAAK